MHLKTRLIAIPAFAAILMLAGGTFLASAAPQAPGKAVVLEYKMPAGRTLTYQAKTEEAQVMEIQGQSMATNSNNTSTFSFKPKGAKDKNFLVGVTIDDLATTVSSSAQGDMSPDMSSVKGKSFDMTLSPLGQEVDVSGAEAITYDMAGETRNLSAGFKTFFPDLPGKPVKIGDSWPSTATTEEKTGAMIIKVDLQYANTLEGFETVDGMECARIGSQITGTVSGSGNQGGMDLTFSGTTKGKDLWYFAVKEGMFVKNATESTSEMSIDVSAAGMTIPMNMTSKGEVKLTAH
jgi:hypothetical protein